MKELELSKQPAILKAVTWLEFEQIQNMAETISNLLQDLEELNYLLQEDLQFREKCGAALVDTPPDGNCLFSAIGGVVGKQPTTLREEACEVLRAHEQYFQDFTPGAFEKYVKEMEQDSTYGDHKTIVALATKYNENILIVNHDGTITTIPPVLGKTDQYIAIGCIKYSEDKVTKEEVNHYVGLQIIDQKKFKSVLQSRVKESEVENGKENPSQLEEECYVHWTLSQVNDNLRIKTYDSLHHDPDFLNHNYTKVLGDFAT